MKIELVKDIEPSGKTFYGVLWEGNSKWFQKKEDALVWFEELKITKGKTREVLKSVII